MIGLVIGLWLGQASALEGPSAPVQAQVRLGVFSTLERAERYSDEMRQSLPMGSGRLETAVAARAWHETTRYHVYVRGFGDTAAAREYCRYITVLGFDCLVESEARMVLIGDDSGS